MDYEWTGWTELTIVPDTDSPGPGSPPQSMTRDAKGVSPPASAAVKRNATELSGEVEDEDLQPNKSPMTEGETEYSSMSEVRFGLNMLGFSDEIVNWLLGSNLDIITEVNEVRRAVRLYGKNQQLVQSHVSEAYSPVRVTGMADKMGLIPGLIMDLTTYDEHGNPWDFNVAAMRQKPKPLSRAKRRYCWS